MARHKPNPHLIVCSWGYVQSAFREPQRIECWRVSRHDLKCEPTVLRIEKHLGRAATHVAREIGGGRKRRVSSGCSYVTTYSAARALMVAAAKQKLSDARESLAFAETWYERAKALPRRSSTLKRSA